MSDSEKINQKRIDKLEERATEAEKFAASLAQENQNLKIRVMHLDSTVQQLLSWQQNFRFDIGDEHLIQMAKRIEELHKEGRI